MFPAESLPDRGRHEIRSLKGDVRIPFKWLGEHAVGGESGRVFMWPSGASYPVTHRRAGRRVQAWKLEAVTEREASRQLFDLLQAGGPIVVMHSQQACQAPDCAIPQFQTVWVESFPSVRVDAVQVARRRWDLDLVPASPAQIGAVAAFDWDDVNSRYRSWSTMVGKTWTQISEGGA